MSQKEKLISVFKFAPGIGKLVIILPLAIIVLAVFFKFQQTMSFLSQKNTQTSIRATPANPISPSPFTQPTPTSTSIKITLDGPISCNYAENKQSIKAFVKNKKISIQMFKDHGENVVVNGDCAYKWESNSSTGEKMCGMTQYISLFEMVAAMNDGGVDVKTILSMFQSSDTQPQGFSNTFIEKAAATCQKVTVNDSVFAIPTRIQFKEIQNGVTNSSNAGELNLFGAPR